MEATGTVNTGHKPEVHKIKVKNHVKGIYTLGTFRVRRITHSQARRYLTAARFPCYKKALAVRLSDHCRRRGEGNKQMRYCCYLNQLSGLEF
jgi:hypothetical protein